MDTPRAESALEPAARRAELERVLGQARATLRVAAISLSDSELREEILELSGGHYTAEQSEDVERRHLVDRYLDVHIEGSPEYAELQKLKESATE